MEYKRAHIHTHVQIQCLRIDVRNKRALSVSVKRRKRCCMERNVKYHRNHRIRVCSPKADQRTGDDILFKIRCDYYHTYCYCIFFLSFR